jgi:DNA-binding transcriptional MerR regulator
MWKPHHLTTLYGIALETARQWAIEFGEYLSPTGKPGKHKHRIYTDEDMRVFALVAQMKGQGSTYEEIHATLKAGQRGDVPAIPPDEVSALAATDRERSLTLQVGFLQQQLLAAKEDLKQLEKIKEQLIQTEQKNAELQARYDEVKMNEKELRQMVQDLSVRLAREYNEGYKAGLKERDQDEGE